jgi:hypothetical protein
VATESNALRSGMGRHPPSSIAASVPRMDAPGNQVGIEVGTEAAVRSPAKT